MAIRNIYDKRRRRQVWPDSAELQFVGLPVTFRRQVSMIIQDALGRGSDRSEGSGNYAWRIYNETIRTLRREWGSHHLAPWDSAATWRYQPELEYHAFLTRDSTVFSEEETDRQLSAIEVIFHLRAPPPRQQSSERQHDGPGMAVAHFSVPEHPEYVPKISATEAVNDLNSRFAEHNLGYRYERDLGIIVRLDSEIVHLTVTNPAIRLLHRPGWETAEEEFQQAHLHYRAGAYEEAVTAATKAFESVLKIVAARRCWASNDPRQPDVQRLQLAQLVNLAVANGLFPTYLNDQFGQLRGLLRAAGTIRNQQAAHGQGAHPRDLPAHVASFALAQAASCIVLVTELDRALGP